MTRNAWCSPLLCAGLLLGATTGQAATGLPGPPTQAPAVTTLFLELVVNGQSSGEVVPVQVRGGHFYVTAEVLQEFHVRTGPVAADGLVAVDQIAGVKVEYDSTAQRLQLTLPPDWLPAQEFGLDAQTSPGHATGGSGFLLNYDLYASDLSRADTSVSIWTEQRFFGAWGMASNTGVYRSTLNGGTGDYLRYDTRWSYSDPDQVRTITVGDLVTGSLSWGSAVRLGGIQIARNFAIRPDLVPYPLPRFSGQAAVPSAVDLFINGYKAGSETVQPGPFTLNTTPFINGAGEASVVTTDALGRQVLTTVPFYVSNTLLKPQTTDYTLALGTLRQDYGIRNFSYGQAATSGSYRLGITDALTLEGRGEWTEGLNVAGFGAVAALARFGVVNLALSDSHNDAGDSLQWNYGYQYNAQHFGFGLQHTERNAGYSDLGTMGSATVGLGQSSTQMVFSGSLGQWGAVSLAYLELQTGDGQNTQIATLNYTKPINNTNFVSVNFSNSLLTHEYNLQLQWTVLLDTLGSLSATGTKTRQGQGSQVQYSRSPPPAGGMGWNLAHASTDGQNDFDQASATWRASSTQLQAGVYAQGRQSASWAGATGSLVVMDGGLFPSNRIHDAFALVSTSGVAGVPVRFENQLVGSTDAAGHLLVTGVNAYYPSRFEIDTLDLPEYMVAPQTEQRIVLRAGSGAVLRFDITQVLAASLTLVDESGQPLPMGMLVQHVGSGHTAVLGWDGQVYLEGLGRDNELLVRGANVPPCRVRFSIDTTAPTVLRLGPLVCRPQSSFAILQLDGDISFANLAAFIPLATGDVP